MRGIRYFVMSLTLLSLAFANFACNGDDHKDRRYRHDSDHRSVERRYDDGHRDGNWRRDDGRGNYRHDRD